MRERENDCACEQGRSKARSEIGREQTQQVNWGNVSKRRVKVKVKGQGQVRSQQGAGEAETWLHSTRAGEGEQHEARER